VAKEVTGMDVDSNCILHAQKKYGTNSTSLLNFKQGDAKKIPLPSQEVELVVSFETIEHLDLFSQKLFLSEIKRVLVKGGVLVMSTPNKENYSDRYHFENEFHINELTKPDFIHLLKNNFKNVVILNQGFQIMSLIAAERKTEQLKVIDYRNSTEHSFSKYMIAIASDEEILPDSLSSVITETGKNYFQLQDRIMELQSQVENLSLWGKNLDKENEELKLWGISLQKEKEQSQVDFFTLKEKQSHDANEFIGLERRLKESLSENMALQKQLTSQKMLANSLQSKLENLETDYTRSNEQNKALTLENENKQKEIQVLNENLRSFYDDKKLIELYHSKDWNLILKLYSIKRKYFSNDSPVNKPFNTFMDFVKRKHKISRKYKESLPVKNNLSEIKSYTNPITIPYFEQPRVSIIIPVYNGWEMNYKCISSVVNNTHSVAYEIILADDCSSDLTKDVSSICKNIIHIRNNENLGFLKNCNHAAKFAKGEFILFLNNDTEVMHDWLMPLVKVMDNDNSAGIVGSKLIYPNGTLQEAGGIIWSDASGWNYGRNSNPELSQYNYVKEVDYISGASIMIRKLLWKKIGGFDERYAPAYFEDSDLAFEVREQGYKVIYQPLSVVVHHEGFSHGTEEIQKDGQPSIKSTQLINHKKFIAKWKRQLQQNHFPNAESVFYARDKSALKKTILVVDHYIPQFDKDAGSKTVFQYLSLFISLGFNVKFIGDNFYKSEPYATALQQMGVEVLHGEWYKNNWKKWLVENAANFDFVLLNRPHISIKYIDFIKENTSAKILYYGHDIHFVRELKQYQIEKRPQLLLSSNQWRQKELYLYGQSDYILTPSEEEAQIIRKIDDSYNVTSILPYFFNTRSVAVTNFSSRKDILFVGGFGHSPNVDAVLWFCNNVWPLVVTKLPDANFLIVGSNVPNEILNLQSSRIEIKGYLSESELNELYKKVKISVIPLRYGAGVKGKTIEALNKGLPIVTTRFGIEGLPGNFNFIDSCDDVNSFANEIVSLYTNEKRLTQMSNAGINYINKYFTMESAGKTMKEVLGIADPMITQKVFQKEEYAL
jgi:GT2 family glycosyltransferase/SAM-dependent methyltransferase